MKANDRQKCPCGSGKAFSDCCKNYVLVPTDYDWAGKPESILFEWLDVYSPPIMGSFIQKARPYAFRVSCYLDTIIETFFSLPFDKPCSNTEAANEAVFAIKNTVLHSLLAAFSCSCQGLFVQSGILHRSLTEDCLVLVDFWENDGQLERFLTGHYSAGNVLTRVKAYVPENVRDWYSYYSKNYTHFGPLHPITYLPTGCYADNGVLALVLQNMVRSVVTFHTVLERVHFNQIRNPVVWKRADAGSGLVFREESVVFLWAERLGRDILSAFPPAQKQKDSGAKRIRLN